jgi:hypothetical protein
MTRRSLVDALVRRWDVAISTSAAKGKAVTGDLLPMYERSFPMLGGCSPTTDCVMQCGIYCQTPDEFLMHRLLERCCDSESESLARLAQEKTRGEGGPGKIIGIGSGGR